MTEVQKYQGKFLERQRQAKLQAKQEKKIEKSSGGGDEERKSKKKQNGERTAED